MNALKSLILAAAFALPAAASAAPFWSVTGGVNHQLPLGATVGSFNPNAGNLANAASELIVPFALEGIAPNPTVIKGGALNLLQNAASLTFTFFGREAGAFNAAFENGVGSVLNSSSAVGASLVSGAVNAASPLAFKFTSNYNGGTQITNGGGLGDKGAGIAFLLSPFNDNVVWAFFDDGGGSYAAGCATGDCDYDDLIVRVSAAAIPLPLPGLLLLGALGGFGWLKRKGTRT